MGADDVKQGALPYFPVQVDAKKLHMGRLVDKGSAAQVQQKLADEPGGFVSKERLKDLGIECGYDLLVTRSNEQVRILAINDGALIGKGGFGVVGVAQDIDSGEFFAVKTMHCKELTDQAKERFQAEDDKLVLVGQFHGECTYPSQDEDGVSITRHASIMTLAPGESLGDWGKKPNDKLSPAEKCHVVAETAKLLADLHEHHEVLHRDIKPDNIHFDRKSGKVSLIDFGTAIKMEDGVVKATLAGTPTYMPPNLREAVKRVKDQKETGLQYEII